MTCAACVYSSNCALNTCLFDNIYISFDYFAKTSVITFLPLLEQDFDQVFSFIFHSLCSFFQYKMFTFW